MKSTTDPVTEGLPYETGIGQTKVQHNLISLHKEPLALCLLQLDAWPVSFSALPFKSVTGIAKSALCPTYLEGAKAVLCKEQSIKDQ